MARIDFSIPLQLAQMRPHVCDLVRACSALIATVQTQPQRGSGLIHWAQRRHNGTVSQATSFMANCKPPTSAQAARLPSAALKAEPICRDASPDPEPTPIRRENGASAAAQTMPREVLNRSTSPANRLLAHLFSQVNRNVPQLDIAQLRSLFIVASSAPALCNFAHQPIRSRSTPAC